MTNTVQVVMKLCHWQDAVTILSVLFAVTIYVLTKSCIGATFLGGSGNYIMCL